MSKRLTNEEKLAKIKNEHRQVLDMVKDSLTQNGDRFFEGINEIMSAIAYDEKEIKRYTALVKAKEKIESLVEKILNAKTVEEVTEIRNSLNYYINKIKREIASRNISDEMFTKYQKQASYLRSDIAKTIRVLKRDKKIEDIEQLISADGLTVDDEILLKKNIKNENRFNKSYLHPSETKRVKKAKKSEVIEVLDVLPNPVVEEAIDSLEVLPTEIDKPVAVDVEIESLEEPEMDTHDSHSVITDSINNDVMDTNSHFEQILDELLPSEENDSMPAEEVHELLGIDEAFSIIDSQSDIENFRLNIIPKELELERSLLFYQKSYDDETEYLADMVDRYNAQYGIQDLKEFGSSRLANIGRFFSNIPNFMKNKEAVSRMIFDSGVYYSGSDFISYISYTRRRNSIKYALRSVFSKSYLTSFEGQCLNHHERCVEWMKEYCKERGLDIHYFKSQRTRSL